MIFDIRNVLADLNGIIIDGGWSEDSDALMVEPIEVVAEPRVGASGEHAFFASGNRGGTVTIKLLPNAAAIPDLQQQAEIVRGGGSVIWDGSLRDTARGYSVALRNGSLISYPPFPSYGRGEVSNYEYVFRFEEIESDYGAPAAGAFNA